MFGSLRIGKFFGIDLNVHGTFWLLPLFVLFGGAFSGNVSGAVFDVAVLFAAFGCIALHEVGHALAARYYGIDTRDITLYPVGGVASLERMPERPLQEIVIALAGPAVNLMIAAGLVAGIVGNSMAFPGTFSLYGLDLFDLFVWNLLLVNAALLAFNLIPAFPMDGGRVLRAVLSIGMRRVDATRVAITVGAVLAAIGLVIGVFGVPSYGITGGNLGLIFVSVVVFLLGQAELAGVRAEAARRRWREVYGEDEFDHTVRVMDVRPHGPFSGWKFDPARRTWVEWRDGIAVREVPVA